MPIQPHQNLLCSYRYDALDRSIHWAPIRQVGIQRFHCKGRLSTEIQDSVKHSIFQHDDHVLAQLQHMDDQVDSTLLATDLQRTVLNALNADRLHSIAYTPYGHHLPSNGLLSLLAFNGERPDPVTGHYHLGNGYRQFNPALMRFNSPDSLSPFAQGGMNAYAYCSGNPVLNTDPTGRTIKNTLHSMTLILRVNSNRMGLRRSTINAAKELGKSTGFTLDVPHARKVSKELLAKNQILAHDEDLLTNYANVTHEQAEHMLPEARNHMLQIRRRAEIVEDVSAILDKPSARSQKYKLSHYSFKLRLTIEIMEEKAQLHANTVKKIRS